VQVDVSQQRRQQHIHSNVTNKSTFGMYTLLASPQVAARSGHWEETKQAVDAAYSFSEELADSKENELATEAFIFSVLCLQLQAAWGLRHKVSHQCLSMLTLGCPVS
jgi:hypothetical protein